MEKETQSVSGRRVITLLPRTRNAAKRREWNGQHLALGTTMNERRKTKGRKKRTRLQAVNNMPRHVGSRGRWENRLIGQSRERPGAQEGTRNDGSGRNVREGGEGQGRRGRQHGIGGGPRERFTNCWASSKQVEKKKTI